VSRKEPMARAEDYSRAIAAMESARRVLVTSHLRPDGDAVGSMAAICEVLQNKGKEVCPLLLSPLPAWYRFLFNVSIPVLGSDIPANALDAEPYAACDLAVVIDTNSHAQLPQIGKWLRKSGIRVVVIDHHITSDHIGDVEVVDTTASAAGIICYHLIKRAGWAITPKMASALFIALGSDTGWFRFSSVDSQTFSVAKALVEFGAKPAKLYRQLYENFSLPRMKLLSRLMQNLKLEMAERLAVVVVMNKDFEEVSAARSDTENLIDEFQRLETVEAVIMLVEQENGVWRCSLRSKGLVDVQKIAAAHGGGGHRAAAGVTMQMPLEKALETLKKDIRMQLAEA